MAGMGERLRTSLCSPLSYSACLKFILVSLKKKNLFELYFTSLWKSEVILFQRETVNIVRYCGRLIRLENLKWTFCPRTSVLGPLLCDLFTNSGDARVAIRLLNILHSILYPQRQSFLSQSPQAAWKNLNTGKPLLHDGLRTNDFTEKGHRNLSFFLPLSLFHYL